MFYKIYDTIYKYFYQKKLERKFYNEKMDKNIIEINMGTNHQNYVFKISELEMYKILLFHKYDRSYRLQNDNGYFNFKKNYFKYCNIKCKVDDTLCKINALTENIIRYIEEQKVKNAIRINSENFLIKMNGLLYVMNYSFFDKKNDIVKLDPRNFDSILYDNATSKLVFIYGKVSFNVNVSPSYKVNLINFFKKTNFKFSVLSR